VTRTSILLLLSLAPGCASEPAYAFAPTTGVTAAPKPPDCQVTILDIRPGRPFDEVGRVVAVSHPVYTPTATTAEELYLFVHTQVCQLGGDAVIAEPDGLGRYWGGPVIRYR